MNYLDFNVEYCDPFNSTMNYWMRLEHLGRYLWACDECSKINSAVVADVACANGYGTSMLYSVAEQVWGFDRSEEYLEKAPKKDAINYVQCDLDKVSPDAYAQAFDMIVCFETIEHVRYPDRLIRLFANSLKPGGKLLLSFPNPIYEKLDEYGLNQDRYHLHILEKDTVVSLLEQNCFDVLALKGQSYCNIKCNEENSAIKAGTMSVESLEASRTKDRESLLDQAREKAMPSHDLVEQSYSFILHCQKRHN